jgi:cytochrome P450
MIIFRPDIIFNRFQKIPITEVFSTIKKLVTEYPRPTRLWLGPRLFVVLDHPDDVQCVINSQNALYKDKVYKFLECFGGPGMITINGDMWKIHRKVLNPCFNMKILESYMPIFNNGSRILAENIEKHAGGDTFNIESYFHACTLDLVIETTMGVPFNIQKNENMGFLNASDM